MGRISGGTPPQAKGVWLGQGRRCFILDSLFFLEDLRLLHQSVRLLSGKSGMSGAVTRYLILLG